MKKNLSLSKWQIYCSLRNRASPKEIFLLIIFPCISHCLERNIIIIDEHSRTPSQRVSCFCFVQILNPRWTSDPLGLQCLWFLYTVYNWNTDIYPNLICLHCVVIMSIKCTPPLLTFWLNWAWMLYGYNSSAMPIGSIKITIVFLCIMHQMSDQWYCKC